MVYLEMVWAAYTNSESKKGKKLVVICPPRDTKENDSGQLIAEIKQMMENIVLEQINGTMTAGRIDNG